VGLRPKKKSNFIHFSWILEKRGICLNSLHKNNVNKILNKESSKIIRSKSIKRKNNIFRKDNNFFFNIYFGILVLIIFYTLYKSSDDTSCWLLSLSFSLFSFKILAYNCN